MKVLVYQQVKDKKVKPFTGNVIKVYNMHYLVRYENDNAELSETMINKGACITTN